MVLLRSLILGVTFLFSKEILDLFFNDCIKNYYKCLQIKTKSLFFCLSTVHDSDKMLTI